MASQNRGQGFKKLSIVIGFFLLILIILIYFSVLKPPSNMDSNIATDPFEFLRQTMNNDTKTPQLLSFGILLLPIIIIGIYGIIKLRKIRNRK